MLTRIDNDAVQSDEGWGLKILDGFREDFSCQYSELPDRELKFGLYLEGNHAISIYGCSWAFEGTNSKIDENSRKAILERIRYACPMWLDNCKTPEESHWEIRDETEERGETNWTVVENGPNRLLVLFVGLAIRVAIEFDATMFGERCAKVSLPHIEAIDGRTLDSAQLNAVMTAVTNFVQKSRGYGVLFEK